MRRGRDAIWRRVYRAWFRVVDPGAYLERPIFIIGCGRSGTTALADVLSQHPNVANVGEARHIWQVLPKADLWDYNRSGRGQLVLIAGDASLAQQALLRRRFAAETAVLGGKRFVEKLPENAFRVDLLNALFPDALFIHLLRDGRDVADSIRRRYESTGRWYGRNGYKWDLFVKQAETVGYADLVPICVDVASRGLLEWRLAVEAAQQGKALVGGERWVEVRYTDLVEGAGAVTERLLQWAGLNFDLATIAYAEAHIEQRHRAAAGRLLTKVEEQIAGSLLKEFQSSYPRSLSNFKG